MTSSLCRLELRTAKISRCLGTKEKPRKHGTEQSVNRQLRDRVKGAQDDMKRNPGKREPARPVLPPEQKYSAHNCGEFGDFNPHSIRMTCQQLAKVNSEAAHAHRQIDAGENRNGDGPLV